MVKDVLEVNLRAEGLIMEGDDVNMLGVRIATGKNGHGGRRIWRYFFVSFGAVRYPFLRIT